MAASMFDSTPSGFHLGGLSEREQVIGYLERGTAVQKFCAKLKPERKTMLVSGISYCFANFNLCVDAGAERADADSLAESSIWEKQL